MAVPDFILDSDGRPVFIQGYGAVYNLLRSDGLELVKPGAFDHAIQHPSAALNCQFHHMGPDFIAGCLALDTFQVWSDDFGLAFSAGPFNANGRNLSLLRLITSGGIRGASRLARPDRADYEFIDGQRVRLKDVREMLFDTGLGSRGYSVLEQGRIDADYAIGAICQHAPAVVAVAQGLLAIGVKRQAHLKARRNAFGDGQRLKQRMEIGAVP